MAWEADGDQDDTSKEQIVAKDLDHLGWESADLGINLDALDNKLRRVSRSGPEEIQPHPMNRIQNIWGWDLLRKYPVAKYKRGRLAKFGGGHMLRSGKRSFQDKDDTKQMLQNNVFFE